VMKGVDCREAVMRVMVKVDKRWKWWRVMCINGLPQLQWWKMMGSSNDGGRRVIA